MTSVDDFLDRIWGRALLAWHHCHGVERSASQYSMLYRDRLRQGLSATRLIYLDTNYWVRLLEIGKQGAASLRASANLLEAR
jgi:gluconate kinase